MHVLQAAQLEKLRVGVQLGGYEATRFKNQEPKPRLQSLDVLQASAGADSAASEQAIQRGTSLAKGNLLARCCILSCVTHSHDSWPSVWSQMCVGATSRALSIASGGG